MRTNCYWYYEVQDMGANIPFCKLKKGLDPLNNASCLECQHYHSKYKPTNADKIRAMSDGQLAQFLYALYESLGCSMDCPAYDTCDAQGSCVDFLAKWLKQEAKE